MFLASTSGVPAACCCRFSTVADFLADSAGPDAVDTSAAFIPDVNNAPDVLLLAFLHAVAGFILLQAALLMLTALLFWRSCCCFHSCCCLLLVSLLLFVSLLLIASLLLVAFLLLLGSL